MDKLLNIIKEEIENCKFFDWDKLDSEIQTDILENIYDNSDYLKNNWNIWTFKEYLDDALDLPKLCVSNGDVNELYNQLTQIGWGINEKQVNRLINVLRTGVELDPILTNNGKLFDGGHRLTAYKRLRKNKIPVVDISSFLNIDWKKWMGD